MLRWKVCHSQIRISGEVTQHGGQEAVQFRDDHTTGDIATGVTSHPVTDRENQSPGIDGTFSLHGFLLGPALAPQAAQGPDQQPDGPGGQDEYVGVVGKQADGRQARKE